MIKVLFSNIRKPYYFPEKWDELNPEQLTTLIEIVKTEPDNHTAKLLILREWMKLPSQQFADMVLQKKYEESKQINHFFIAEVEEKLLPFLDPFLEYNGFEVNIMKKLVVPGLRKETLIGFSDRMESISAAEYSYASHFYQLYVEDPTDISNLHKFVACLYRPQRTDGILPGHADYNGDMRAPFNSENIDFLAAKVAKISPVKLQAVKFCFERISKWIAELENYEFVFKGDPDKEADYVDWDRIIRMVAGDKLGSLENVRKLPILGVFQELQYLEEDLRAAESAAPIQANKYQEL